MTPEKYVTASSVPLSQAPRNGTTPNQPLAGEKAHPSSDKNRLSLSFLGRSSVPHTHADNHANGHRDSIDKQSTSGNSTSKGGSREPSKNRLSFLAHDDSQQFSDGARSVSNERPRTGKSEPQSVGDRMGSMKKRLSELNIGRKPSKINI